MSCVDRSAARCPAKLQMGSTELFSTDWEAQCADLQVYACRPTYLPSLEGHTCELQGEQPQIFSNRIPGVTRMPSPRRHSASGEPPGTRGALPLDHRFYHICLQHFRALVPKPRRGIQNLFGFLPRPDQRTFTEWNGNISRCEPSFDSPRGSRFNTEAPKSTHLYAHVCVCACLHICI